MDSPLYIAANVDIILYGKVSKFTSSIVQFIFFFWSFEINGNILKIRIFFICLDPCILNRFTIFEPHLD